MKEKYNVIIKVVIILSCFMFFSLFHYNTPENGKSVTQSISRSDYGCGPTSLATLCKLIGIKTSPKEIAILAGADENGVTSMYGLAQAAKVIGLRAVGYSMTFDELKMESLPVIAHVKGSHFIVIQACDQDSVTVIDNGKKKRYENKDFIKIWNGTILEIRKE